MVVLRNPRWNAGVPYHDIGILVFTRSQWQADMQGNLSYCAGGVEVELAHNNIPPHDVWVWGAADRAWVWGDGKSVADIVSNPVPGSYALNGWLYDTATFGGAAHPELMMSKQSSIQKPVQTPVFVDAMWVDLWPSETDLPSTDLYNGRLETGMTRCTIARHGAVAANAPRNFDIRQSLPGSVNMGMADGHVQSVKLENLWNYSWHLNWTPPSKRPQ